VTEFLDQIVDEVWNEIGKLDGNDWLARRLLSDDIVRRQRGARKKWELMFHGGPNTVFADEFPVFEVKDPLSVLDNPILVGFPQ
jgi:hypothetical protein